MRRWDLSVPPMVMGSFFGPFSCGWTLSTPATRLRSPTALTSYHAVKRSHGRLGVGGGAVAERLDLGRRQPELAAQPVARVDVAHRTS
jgi:hypothetical protein